MNSLHSIAAVTTNVVNVEITSVSASSHGSFLLETVWM